MKVLEIGPLAVLAAVWPCLLGCISMQAEGGRARISGPSLISPSPRLRRSFFFLVVLFVLPSNGGAADFVLLELLRNACRNQHGDRLRGAQTGTHGHVGRRPRTMTRTDDEVAQGTVSGPF